MIILVAVSITSCVRAGFPTDKVYQGTKPMVVYKIEVLKNDEYGKYRYGITDATNRGWQLKSFEKYNIGDIITFHVSEMTETIE